MILEGIMTTLDESGEVNISPMGPSVDSPDAESLKVLVLRPFKTSRTYENLKRTGEGIFHVTDDVELIARGAVKRIETLPAMHPATAVQGMILSNACRWYALRVRTLDDAAERTIIVTEVVDSGRQRDYFGLNRGKHAVLEAAILATRLHLLDAQFVRCEYERLQVMVNKTGGEQEHRAMEFLRGYVAETLQDS